MDTTILDKMFPKGSIPESYWEGCDYILVAMKEVGGESESEYWEKAGFFFAETDKKDWGRHMIEIAQRIDRKNKREGRFQ
jgi:hypothetical protein